MVSQPRCLIAAMCLYQEVHLNALHLEVYITCPERGSGLASLRGVLLLQEAPTEEDIPLPTQEAPTEEGIPLLIQETLTEEGMPQMRLEMLLKV